MGLLTYTRTLIAGTAENVNHVQDMFNDARTIINGNIDGDNLSTLTGQSTGVSATGLIRRGKCIIATEESRTNVAYGLLTTPDQVDNIVVATDGLLFVKYSALVKSSNINQGQTSIFLSGTQAVGVSGTGAPVASNGPVFGGTADDYDVLYTSVANSPASILELTTGVGQASRGTPIRLGSAICFEVAAGTYTVTVQWKAAAGSITAKERKLWVWSIGF